MGKSKPLLSPDSILFKKSKDESILAWQIEIPNATTRTYSGLYALSSLVYIDCAHIVPMPGSRGIIETNVEVSTWSTLRYHTADWSLALLHCRPAIISEEKVFGILLAGTSINGEYVGVRDPEDASARVRTGDREVIVAGESQICVSNKS